MVAVPGGWHGQTHPLAPSRQSGIRPVGVCQALGSVGTTHTRPLEKSLSQHMEQSWRAGRKTRRKTFKSYLLLVCSPSHPYHPSGVLQPCMGSLFSFPPSLSRCTPLFGLLTLEAPSFWSAKKLLVPDSFFFFNFPQEKNVELIIYVKCQMQERGCAYLDIPSEAK